MRANKAFISKEPLINSEAPATQGCVAKIDDYQSLILKQSGKSYFPL